MGNPTTRTSTAITTLPTVSGRPSTDTSWKFQIETTCCQTSRVLCHTSVANGRATTDAAGADRAVAKTGGNSRRIIVGTRSFGLLRFCRQLCPPLLIDDLWPSWSSVDSIGCCHDITDRISPTHSLDAILGDAFDTALP